LAASLATAQGGEQRQAGESAEAAEVGGGLPQLADLVSGLDRDCLLLRLCGCTARQAHRKHRAFARLARHGHVAAHHACELAGDGKAEPRAAVAARCKGIGLRNSPLSRPSWVIVPISSTSVGADPEQDVDARAAMASSERGNQDQAAANRWARASRKGHRCPCTH
jgi:hypothetical protein